MEPVFEPERDGYFATFRGSLSVDQLERVRLQAAETYPDESLRWAVLDMLGAWVEPATTSDQEGAHLANVHLLADRVQNAKTPDLRIAVVASDEVTTTLLRLTSAAIGLAGGGDDGAVRAVAHFADVDAATAWATAGPHGIPGAG